MRDILKFFIYYSLVILISSCAAQDRDAKSVYENKESFLRDFKNTSVIRSRGKNIIELSYRSDGLINKFYFEKQENNIFKLTKDTIQFDLKDAIATRSINREDTIAYNSQMTAMLNRYINKMDSLNIRDISTQFYLQGIDSKIYFNSSNNLLYVSDLKRVKNKEWTNFLRKCEKFDRNWYYEEN